MKLAGEGDDCGLAVEDGLGCFVERLVDEWGKRKTVVWK